MNKKALWIPVVLIILAVAGISWYLKEQNPPGPYSDQIVGQITERKENSIVVEGYLDLNDPERKLVTIEFTITPETKLINHTSFLGGHEPGKFFTPEVQESVGKFADLLPKTRINTIKAKGNLYNKTRVEAIEVDYGTVTFDTKNVDN